MKQAILISASVLALTTVYGQANVYHPFPDSNAVWVSEVCVFNPGNPPPQCGSGMYFLNGDTIANAVKYSKLCGGYGQAPITIGGIRNDTLSKKTYFICFNPNINPNCSSHLTEKVLYNFNAGIGDTVFYGTCGISWKVMSIDSMQLLDGTSRKRFNTNFGYALEGIGTNGNLLCGSHDGMAELHLLCFQKDGISFYELTPSIYNSAYPYACLNNSVDERSAIRLQISISSNPFSSQTIIQADQVLKNASLTTYNSFGQTVKRIDNLSGQTIVFQRDNLPSGMYFVQLTQENKVIGTDKLMISD